MQVAVLHHDGADSVAGLQVHRVWVSAAGDGRGRVDREHQGEQEDRQAVERHPDHEHYAA